MRMAGVLPSAVLGVFVVVGVVVPKMRSRAFRYSASLCCSDLAPAAPGGVLVPDPDPTGDAVSGVGCAGGR